MRMIWRKLCVMPLYLYRYFISPAMPPACRFHPSCSMYAIEAIMVHGVLKGSWLTLCRLARCRPFGGAGFDPVPPAAENAGRSSAKE